MFFVHIMSVWNLLYFFLFHMFLYFLFGLYLQLLGLRDIGFALVNISHQEITDVFNKSISRMDFSDFLTHS